MRLILHMALLGALLAAQASAATFVLNTDNTYPRSTPEGEGFQDLIMKEMFRRIGHEAKIVHMPSERALVTANQGIDDGNFVRIAGIEKAYPNLVMVPEPVCDFEFSVFTWRRDLKIRGWESLKPYNVGIITGWKILEANIVSPQALVKARDGEALFDLLSNNRVDLVVYDRLQGEALLRKRRLQGVILCKPPLIRKEMYLYLNRRHAAQVDKLAKALKDMKLDGTWRKLMRSVPWGEK